MRTYRLPPDDARTVVWQHVIGVRYVAEGRRRFLVLTYKNGAELHMAPHQARDLWYEIKEPRGCPAPCFYRHDCDTSPTDCMECQLAEALEGVDVLVRPDPIPPRRGKPEDVRNFVIAALVVLCILLIGVASDAVKKSPTPKQEPAKRVAPQSPSKAKKGVSR